MDAVAATRLCAISFPTGEPPPLEVRWSEAGLVLLLEPRLWSSAAADSGEFSPAWLCLPLVDSNAACGRFSERVFALAGA